MEGPAFRLSTCLTWIFAAAPRYGILLLLAALSIVVNGYHYATDDAGIYLPEILQRLNPSLYPANAAFIDAQSSVSIYAVIASTLARIFGGSVQASVLALHFLGILTLLVAALSLAEQLFPSPRAAWSAVCVLAGATSIYVAGTSIPILDPYFTARTLSTPLTLVALASAVRRKWLLAFSALALAAAIHPLMALFAALLIASYACIGAVQMSARVPVFAASIIPLGLSWGPLDAPARETMTLAGRTFFYAARWNMFDWAGVAVPLAIFLFLWRIPVRATAPLLRRLCASALLCGTVATLSFLAISFSPNLETFVRLQPMRVFQLIYIVLFLILGGLLGEYVLRTHIWRWSLLLLLLTAVDFGISRNAYPASSHIEWPGVHSDNVWVQAFNWARMHTPVNALFALPPDYIYAAGEDRHGFRAVAERSSLVDQLKDSSVVSIFPELGPEWKRQFDAQSDWDDFTPADFHSLAQKYPITWAVVELPQNRGLDCPYRNPTVAVCRIH